MSAIEAWDVVAVVDVELADLEIDPRFRESLSDRRVASLASDHMRWDPIVVSGRTGRVIDGRHRVAAARALGWTTIRATVFEGDADAESDEFVRLNAQGVLPVDRSQRQAAARRLLERHPDWADRRVGEVCGMSPKTIARLRSSAGRSVGETRVGRDGRSRPVDPSMQRARILEALVDQPDASLRTIARELGVSPETVRRVRLGMEGEGSHQTADEVVPMPPPISLAQRRIQRPNWVADRAFQSRADGALAVDFLERTDVTEVDIGVCVESIPLSQVYEIADEARRRAAVWARLADTVETRARSGRR